MLGKSVDLDSLPMTHCPPRTWINASHSLKVLRGREELGE